MAVLSKLLKYDLRANLKIFLFIWPAILVFGLLERVALMAELPVKISAIFVNLTTVLFVLAVIAACVFALVISVIRFYSGLLLPLHLLQHGAYAGKICAVFQKFLFHVFLRSGKGRQNAALFLIICGIKLLW